MADYEKNESVDQSEEAAAEDTVQVVESVSQKDSIVKSLEQEFSEAAKVAESSFVREVEKLPHASDPWAALKNLGGHKDEQNHESASDGNDGESLEATKTCDETHVVASERETDDLHENPKGTHGQTEQPATCCCKCWIKGLLSELLWFAGLPETFRPVIYALEMEENMM